MSSNDTIRLHEQPDGSWYLYHYDIDEGLRSALYHEPTLDAILDRARDIHTEYGLSIVRMKDYEAAYVMSSYT